jgi:ATP-binding cassette, subfamily C, bacterial LapB
MAHSDSKGVSSGALPLLPALEWPVLVAAAAVNLLALALPLVTLQVYDRVLPYAAVDTLHALAALIVGALLLDGGLKAARAYVSGWAGARFEHRLAQASVDRLLAAPVTDIERVTPGEQLDRLAAVEPLREFHANQGPTILVDLPFAAVFLALLWLIGGPLVWVPLGLLGVFAALAVLSGSALRTAAAERATLDERRYSFLIEIFSGIHTIKALGLEPMMVRRYERLLDSAAMAAQRGSALGSHAQTIGGLFGQLATAGTVLVGAWAVTQGSLTIGALAACTMLAGRALQPLMKAMGVWTYFQSIRVARERLDRMLALPAERPERVLPMGALSGDIKLENVTFAYGNGPPLFEGLDLAIRPGEAVAIVGGNGTGKSTLLSLIGGALKPTSGRVLHDDIDVQNREASSLRRQVAHLPQQGALFKGTILQNLTLFRTGAAADDAVRLAAALGLDRVVARQPQGFDTKVAHGAQDALPGGVRQRIAVIRALVGNPPIILFDEANVALDGDSDEKLRQLLVTYKGRRTMVLVSYRPSILKLADRVLKIEGGRLVAVARPEQLQPAPAPAQPQKAVA